MRCADSRMCEIHLVTYFSIETNSTDPSTVVNGSNGQNNSSTLNFYSTFSCSTFKSFYKNN